MSRYSRTTRQQVKYFAYLPALLAGLLLGGLICAACALWIWLENPQTLPFRQVRIIGELQHLNSNILSKQISGKITGGFFSINLSQLKKELVKTPWVEEVSLRRIPGVLIVTIEEQRPIATLE